MNKRDLEDSVMQARENVREVVDEVKKDMSSADMERAVAELWHALPEELKLQIAQDKPEIAKAFGQAQGNPWGSLPAPMKTQSPFSVKKGR